MGRKRRRCDRRHGAEPSTQQCDTSGVPKAVHMRNHFHVGIKVIWKFQANRLPSASTANNASIPDLQNLEHPPSKASPTGITSFIFKLTKEKMSHYNEKLRQELIWRGLRSRTTHIFNLNEASLQYMWHVIHKIFCVLCLQIEYEGRLYLSSFTRSLSSSSFYFVKDIVYEKDNFGWHCLDDAMPQHQVVVMIDGGQSHRRTRSPRHRVASFGCCIPLCRIVG
ncbi:hypothetical protein VPH35_078369 [Triticum aestivum]